MSVHYLATIRHPYCGLDAGMADISIKHDVRNFAITVRSCTDDLAGSHGYLSFNLGYIFTEWLKNDDSTRMNATGLEGFAQAFEYRFLRDQDASMHTSAANVVPDRLVLQRSSSR